MCLGRSSPASRTWSRPRKTGNCTPPSISPVRAPCSSGAGSATARTAASGHRSNSSWRPSWKPFVKRADRTKTVATHDGGHPTQDTSMALIRNGRAERTTSTGNGLAEDGDGAGTRRTAIVGDRGKFNPTVRSKWFSASIFNSVRSGFGNIVYARSRYRCITGRENVIRDRKSRNAQCGQPRATFVGKPFLS